MDVRPHKILYIDTLVIVALVIVCLLVAGCAMTQATSPQPTSRAMPATVVTRTPSAKASPVRQSAPSKTPKAQQSAPRLSLITEPDAGPGLLYALLRSAQHNLDLVIYELEDSKACAVLAADAQRGVHVRVLLDKRFVGRYNEPAFNYLKDHGVAVRWAPSRFDLTHEKALVIDKRLAAIMTLNLTARYYASTRDFVLLDRRRTDVAAVEATFASDWSGGSGASAPSSGLVWSPGAEQALVRLIGSARHTLLVENEEMSDSVVIAALEAAARRGVHVVVVMTRDSYWAHAFDTLARAGVTVRTYAYSAPLYIHAKVIVVDPTSSHRRVFVGSQNFSVASLLYNRELGIITSQRTIVARITAVVRRDAAGATLWRP